MLGFMMRRYVRTARVLDEWELQTAAVRKRSIRRLTSPAASMCGEWPAPSMSSASGPGGIDPVLGAPDRQHRDVDLRRLDEAAPRSVVSASVTPSMRLYLSTSSTSWRVTSYSSANRSLSTGLSSRRDSAAMKPSM